MDALLALKGTSLLNTLVLIYLAVTTVRDRRLAFSAVFAVMVSFLSLIIFTGGGEGLQEGMWMKYVFFFAGQLFFAVFLKGIVNHASTQEAPRAHNAKPLGNYRARGPHNVFESGNDLEENTAGGRDRLAGILAAMGEGLLVVNNNLEVVLLNPFAERLLGVSRGKATGKSFDEVFRLYQGEKRLTKDDNPLVRALRNGETLQTHLEDAFSLEGALGKKFPVSIVTNPLFEDSKLAGGVAVFRDNTEEKKLDESKVNFISVASHQLRTPLTAVRWYAEMLMSGDAGTLSDSQRQFIEEVYRGTTRLIEMVNMLLSLARVESGRVKVEPFKIDVVAFTKTIIQELDVEVKRNDTHLLCVEPSSTFPAISLDPSILRQVIVNLLSNAIRYTPRGGNVEVAFEAHEEAIRVSVRDDGIGIPPEKQSRVFEKFFRADNALAKVPEGTGLGLNLAKELVDLWGGSVWFESPTAWRAQQGGTDHKGSCFFFTIPYKGMSPRLEGKPLA